MPKFQYRARSNRGDLLEGILEGADTDTVAAQLLHGGVTPIEILERETRADPFAALRRGLAYRRPDLSELMLFCRQMYTLMKSGVPIVRGMRSLAESTRNAMMVEVLEEVTAELESGRDLSSALGRYPEIFTTLFQSMVRVGENTGRLDEAFLRIAQYLELEKETRDRIKSALRYPAFVVIAIGVAIAIINLLVIPAFATLFERSNVELPWATQVLMTVSSLSVLYWPHALGGLVALSLFWMHWLKTEAGRYRWDKFKLRLPIVGDILRRATMARFARAFSMSARAGVPLIQTLTVISRALDNEFVGDRILQMRNGIERGDTLTRTAASTGLFTPLVLQMMAVGEETGAVDDLLDEVAGFYEREVDHDIKNLSAALEPVLVIAVGSMVLMLALGVFLPMWDLATGASGG